MKKIMIAFASVLVLAACGTGTSQATATDSAATTVDTTLVATDSTAVPTEVPAEVTTDKAVAEEVK
jgi:ABC-type glycerol-3-phosphate transport system substrate-binding protein